MKEGVDKVDDDPEDVKGGPLSKDAVLKEGEELDSDKKS